MAQIECVECGRKISDRAPACPRCGCPVAAPPTGNESEVPSSANACASMAVADQARELREILMRFDREQSNKRSKGLMGIPGVLIFLLGMLYIRDASGWLEIIGTYVGTFVGVSVAGVLRMRARDTWAKGEARRIWPKIDALATQAKSTRTKLEDLLGGEMGEARFVAWLVNQSEVLKAYESRRTRRTPPNPREETRST